MRKLSLTDATFVGLAAMLGAGVFIVFGYGANLAGSLLPLSIVLAGSVAFLNAGSVAQLAAKETRSGGGYVYGRKYLNNTLGFTAGAAFLIGKSGSSAVIAYTVAFYLTPSFPLITAVGAVVVMTVINLLGINRTAFGSKVLALITIFFLLFLIGSSLALPNAEIALEAGNILGVLSAAALVFFAFAGYARVATLGGELKNPTADVPRAVWISFAIVLVLYLVLSSVLMAKLGKGMGESIVPVAQLAALNWDSPNLTGVFVAIASLGSLLALLAGMSRTASEMAVDGELPAAFAKKLKNGAPHIAELSLAVLVLALSLGGGIFVSLGVSSFCVLVYYAIVNLAAFRQPESGRPKFLSILGLLACLLLAFSVPMAGLIQGSILLLLALLLRWGLRLVR